MSDWFDLYQQQKQRMLEANKDAGDWNGIRDTFVNVYPDDIHFIYELLQNADDQGAREAYFWLYDNQIVFEHDGLAFKQSDVKGITRIGTSGKPEQSNKIGRYGIGFKSVYSITHCPEVYTHLDDEPFAFAIDDLVVPKRLLLQEDHPQAGVTRFVLPFKQERASEIYKQLASKLRNLGADTIMFLNCLHVVSWEATDQSGTYFCERPSSLDGVCRLKSEVVCGDVATHTKAHYQCYSKRVPVEAGKEDLTISIAFLLEDGQIKEEKDKPLNVYFPTKKETRLKFRLHAPMLLTPDRANIRDNCKVNENLINECATLLKESLPKLRNAGLLTVGCLNCLPIRSSDFPTSSFFRPMYDAVSKALRGEEPLLPTTQDSPRPFVNAKHAKISDSGSVRELLNGSRLTELLSESMSAPTCWLSVTSERGASAELWKYLKEELEVGEISNERFVSLLHTTFIHNQSDAWMIRFYDTAFRSYQAQWDKLRKKAVIRREDDTHVQPRNDDNKPMAYLPLPGNKASGFPTVKSSIVKDAGALQFLQEAMLLSEPDKVDVVLTHILPKYKSTIGYDKQKYASDIALIGEAIEQVTTPGYNSSRKGDLDRELKQTKFILAKNASTNKLYWMLAQNTLQQTSELLAWYQGNPSFFFVSDELQACSQWPVILERINIHAKTIAGAVTVHVPEGRKEKDGNITLSGRKPYMRGIAGFDPDADIEGLAHAIKHINPARARILWQLLLDHSRLLRGIVQQSEDTQFTSPRGEPRASKIYTECNDSAWLPVGSKGFDKPRNVLLIDLPHDFDKNSHRARELANQLGMKRIEASEEEKNAAKLGMSLADIELIKKNKASFEQWKATRPVFFSDDDTDTYSPLRGEKVGAQQEGMSEVTYEKRLRSVRVSSRDLRDDDRQYLMNFYQNSAKEMLCQICGSKAFLLDNGQPYFVSVHCLNASKIISKLEKHQELLNNHLALCPNCAAKYLYANEYKDRWHELQRLILSTTKDIIPIKLAGQPCEIRFKAKHIGDLRAVLKKVSPAT